MIIQIKTVPGAKRNAVVKESDLWRAETWKVYVTAPPVDGKANAAVIDILAEHFQVRKQSVKIIKGLKSRDKTISINGQ